ncbi:hypothetical protein PO909_031556 [Leuciscus waleckii]
MATYTKEKNVYISIGFWLILGVECFSGWSNHIVTVKTGGSVTIPCHYDEKKPPQKKYWFSETPPNRTYTNTTKENLSVIDHPDQSLFTVTMRNMQSSTHNGDYYCVVETDGKQNVTYELHLEVQSVPDVSVMNSSVSGHEGDNVSVQCFYTSGYKDKLKQWCRYKDKGCYTEKRNDTSQNASVQISDDGRSSFTVLMTGLRLSDSGWYFCSAGKALNLVHLTVTKAEPVNGATDNPRDSSETGNKNNSTAEGSKEQKDKDLLTVWLPVSAALLLLLILVGVFTWRRKQRPKQDKHQNRERNDSGTIDAISKPEEDPVIYNTIDDEPRDPNKDVTYSTICDAPVSDAKPPAGGTIYSTVAPH